MRPEVPHPRLSKDGKRVVCTKIDCGYPFADILRRPDYGTQGLDFLPGWARGADGVWRMSKRAFTNERLGRGRRVRRAPNPDTPLVMLVAGRRNRPTVRERGYRPDSVWNYVFTNTFPIEIECPNGGHRQVATEEILGLSGRRATLPSTEESGTAPTLKKTTAEPNHRP